MTDYYQDSDFEGSDHGHSQNGDWEHDGELDHDEAGHEEFGSENYDLYDGDGQGIENLRPSEVEGKTSWMYLGFLMVLFALLVGFSWACNDRSDPPGEPQTELEAAESLVESAMRLDVMVEGDVVTISGAVPDNAARDQILVETQNLYGAENVIDELVVDESTSLEDAVVSVTGSAVTDDGRPEALQEVLGAGLGLGQGDFSIDFGDAIITPVSLAGEVSNGSISFAGTVPDDVSVVDLVAAGEAAFGAGNVDVSGLTLGDATWTDGVITVTGTVAPGDEMLETLPTEVQDRFGALVTVDTTAVTVDQSPAVLTELEQQVRGALETQPILFDPLSPDIDPASDQVIVDIAAILQLVPDISVEVVGHTDSAGNDDENLVLSQDRAEAVIARLVELGVDGARLNARGEGEAVPIGDNGTPEGREQNRRIEFRLIPG